MKSNVLVDYLNANGAKPTAYNTNNAWGFGGGIGIKYDLPSGVSVKIGKACYRHQDPTKYITIKGADGHYTFDEENTPKNRALAVKCLEGLK